MIPVWLYALASTLLVSLVSLTGIAFLLLKPEKLRNTVFILVSLAVGALLGNVFFHLVPESYESISGEKNVALLITGGILLFFVMEKFLHWHHGHDVDQLEEHPRSFGYVSLLADGLHNFTDGILIAAGWMAGPETGIATTLTVLIHEIPQEISDFGILVHAGFSWKKALLLNFYVALTAILGTGVTLLAGSALHGLQNYILPLAAGGFIYLAATDLIPELHKERSLRKSALQLVMILAGLLLIALAGGGHSH